MDLVIRVRCQKGIEDAADVRREEAAERGEAERTSLPSHHAVGDEALETLELGREVGREVDAVLALDRPDVDFLAALDRKSTRLNSSHIPLSRMPSSA